MNMVHKILKNLSRAFAVAMIVGPFFTGNAGAICNDEADRYPVSGTNYCNWCPWGVNASGVSQCNNSGFTCKTGWTRHDDNYQWFSPARYSNQTMTEAEAEALGFYVGQDEDCKWVAQGWKDHVYYYKKVCYDRDFSKQYYTCECTAENSYHGYNDGSDNITGATCHTCPNYDWVTCSNSGGFSCNLNYHYKTAYKDAWHGNDDYGKYNCQLCPYIDNSNEIGVYATYPGLILADELTWAAPTTPEKRCVGQVKETKSQSIGGGTAKYKIIDVTPASSCTGFDRTSEMPEASTAPSYCTYEYKKKYLSTPAGYRVINNNTQNATVEPCPDGKYSTDDMLNCSNPPEHSSVNANSTDFICDTGYYKSGSVCVRCPLDMNEYTNYTNWTIGTTSAAGATEVTSCFISGPSRGDIYEQSTGHTFQYVGSCNWSGSFLPYYTLCIDGQTWSYLTGYQQQYESCISALRNFAENTNTLNVGTGYGQADSWINSCVYAAVTSSGSCSDASPAMMGYNIFQTNDPSVVQTLLTTANEACSGALRILTNQPPRSDTGCLFNRQ